MDKVIKILRGCLPFVDFDKETALVDDGIVESLDIVMVVGELSDQFDIEIGMDDLIPANFNSAAAIYNLVCRLQEGTE